MEMIDHAQALLALSPDATFIVDEDGNILFASQQTTALLGYEPEELIGKAVEMLIPKKLMGGHVKIRRNYVKNPSLRPMGLGQELHALTKDGRHVPVEVSLSPIETSDGMLVSAAVRDVSYRKEYERELKAARDTAEQANRAKSRFLAAASHDLRQPLQSLSAYLEVLKHRVEGDVFQSVADKMDLSLKAMGGLLDALLDISQLESGSIEPKLAAFSLQGLLDTVIASNRPAAEQKYLVLTSLPTNLAVHSDITLLTRIIDNFVTNAIRYTEQGEVRVDCTLQGDQVRVAVTDTGVGIPPDQVSHIFQDYYQLGNAARERNKGLGLGLAIVQRISNLLGHQVDVQSVLNEGSVFSIIVPLARQDDVHETDLLATSTGTEGGQTKLLLVDDDPAVLDSLKLLLGLSGFDIVAAKDPTEALDYMESGGEPDILITDYRLPVMNGVDLVKRVRGLAERDIPAVLISGDTSEEKIRDSELANYHVMHKPSNAKDLIALLKNLS